MPKALGVLGAIAAAAVMFTLGAARSNPPGRAPSPMTPADGHTIHVLAPHVIEGHVMGPFHHYCKVISPEPIIECLIYLSTDSMAPLTEIEYIVAKSMTRTRSEEHTSELQSQSNLVCRLLLEKKKKKQLPWRCAHAAPRSRYVH